MLQWCKEWGRSMLYVYSLLSFSFQRRCDANVISTSIYRSSTTTPLRWLRSCDDDQQLSYDDSSVVIVLTTTSHGVVIRASRRRTAVIRVSATLMRRRHGCRLPETRARERERERARNANVEKSISITTGRLPGDWRHIGHVGVIVIMWRDGRCWWR